MRKSIVIYCKAVSFNFQRYLRRQNGRWKCTQWDSSFISQKHVNIHYELDLAVSKKSYRTCSQCLMLPFSCSMRYAENNQIVPWILAIIATIAPPEKFVRSRYWSRISIFWKCGASTWTWNKLDLSLSAYKWHASRNYWSMIITYKIVVNVSCISEANYLMLFICGLVLD